MREGPLLSVVMITYGHENYIRQAVEAVFEQKTDFPFEFIIANDASPDKTDDILQEILPNAPKNIIIKYFRHEKNIGMMPNFKFAIEKAIGKYVAYFEGDDYWTDGDKLQTQVNFLERNEDFSIICHNVEILENGVFEKENYLDRNLPPEVFSITDLARRNIVPTLTAVFRNKENLLPNWILESPIGDLPMFMRVSESGKIKFINKKLAVYRKNIGIWNKINNDANYKMIKLYDYLLDEYSDKPMIVKNLQIAKTNYMKELLKSRDISFSDAFRCRIFKRLNFIDQAKIVAKKFL